MSASLSVHISELTMAQYAMTFDPWHSQPAQLVGRLSSLV